MSDTTGLLMKALDEALAVRLAHLFGVLCVAGDLDEGMPKFQKGMDRALEAYELVRSHLTSI